jgi:hypothetical protein
LPFEIHRQISGPVQAETAADIVSRRLDLVTGSHLEESVLTYPMDLFGRNGLNVDHGFHLSRRDNHFPAIGPFRQPSIFSNQPDLNDLISILQ